MAWPFWLATLIILTVVMHGVRGEIEEAHVVIPYLLVVLGGSSTGGRALGFTLAVLSFLLIDYYFQVPFDTLSVGKPLDWVVLLAFLATAAVATQLLTRAQDEAREAERRAREIEELSRVAAHAPDHDKGACAGRGRRRRRARAHHRGTGRSAESHGGRSVGPLAHQGRSLSAPHGDQHGRRPLGRRWRAVRHPARRSAQDDLAP